MGGVALQFFVFLKIGKGARKYQEMAGERGLSRTVISLVTSPRNPLILPLSPLFFCRMRPKAPRLHHVGVR